MVLALVLGPMMEQALRQALMMSRGEFGIFLSRPIAATLLAAAVLLLVFHAGSTLRGARAQRPAMFPADVAAGRPAPVEPSC
jgi:putative tricarboxylic transport membrane protein